MLESKKQNRKLKKLTRKGIAKVRALIAESGSDDPLRIVALLKESDPEFVAKLAKQLSREYVFNQCLDLGEEAVLEGKAIVNEKKNGELVYIPIAMATLEQKQAHDKLLARRLGVKGGK
jgi:hypothetical protein